MDQDALRRRKKTISELVYDKRYTPMKIKEIAILLQIPKEQRNELKEVLDELVAEGKISISKKGKYGKPESNAVTGTFIGHIKGFGFVETEETEDIFIPENQVNGAFHYDKVKVVITTEAQNGKRCEGKIVSVIEHGITDVIGIYQKNKTFGFVIPDNGKIAADIFIPEEKSKGAVTGHKVVVKIKTYGQGGKNPEGIVTEIIGHINDPGTDIMSIIKAYDLPVEFPEDVMSFLNHIPNEVQEKDKEGRLDLRSLRTVTIDGEDAKDLDDAISITKRGNVYQLGVHIADVTHYVTEYNPLDREAYKRGTSVYLVDRVIPMLPHKLSNGICSLNEGTDRLALSCLMDIDEKGNVTGHKIAETLICVDKRMTYTGVKQILADKEEAEIKKYEELMPMFTLMEELAAILRAKRKKRGSIDFDFPESKIILDAEGKPLDIQAYDRNVATKIIEEFMLAANETVAEDYFWQELPFVYRSHDNPDPEKILKLAAFINNFGYSIKMTADDIHPKEIQKLLAKIDETPEETIISRLALRSMKRAEYTTECVGHFGLAAKYYCHFTSPIRRYPDLQIHRIIKENIHNKINAKRKEHYQEILPEAARHSGITERRADDAERDTDKLKMVEYMEKRIGEQFDGVISGITAWGIYVELPNTIEGMISVTALRDGYYIYDENNYEMINETTNRTFKLGQKLRIKVVRTDKMLRTIDFEPAEE